MRRRCGNWFCWMMVMGLAAAQTRVSLKNQGRDFDFADAARVRPFTVTNSLPTTCRAGEMRFRTDVSAGQNLYGCAVDNLWVPMAVSTASLDPGVRLNRTSATQLIIGSDCALANPCRFRFGAVVHSIAAPGILTLSGSGDGQIFVYITTAGQFGAAMTPTSSLTLSCSGCVVQAAATGFPLDSIPLWTWTATAGAWDTSCDGFHQPHL